MSGQLAQQCKLRITSQGGVLKEVANSKLRGLSAYDKSFKCTDVRIGNTPLSYEAVFREGAPRWRGPAKILDIDEPCVTVELQSQIF